MYKCGVARLQDSYSMEYTSGASVLCHMRRRLDPVPAQNTSKRVVSAAGRAKAI